MRIGLIRHGETDWNKQALFQGTSDIPLNAYGFDQARRTAVLLDHQPWTRLFCSPLTRTTQTAGVIGERLCLTPVPLPGVIERSFGELEGKRVFREDGTRRTTDHPSVEPAAEVVLRTRAALREVAAGCGDALVVTHGTVIRLLLNELLTVPAPAIQNLALSVIEVDPAHPNNLRLILAGGYPVSEKLLASV